MKSWLIWKDPDAGRLKAGGEGDDRGWDGWMASPTQWTWVWVNSRSWWWTGRPGVLWFMGSQRVGHDWMTELNWTEFQPHKTVSLINVCVLTASPTDNPLISFSLLKPSYSLRQSNIELKPINNLTMASGCSSERKSHTLENLNPKLVRNAYQKPRSADN